VPIAVAVAHQAGAVLLLGATVVAGHWSMGGARRDPRRCEPASVPDSTSSLLDG
jgi:heme A synthase